jgi:hypothetical protein
MAKVHCAAATENFLVLENHSVDVPWWSDLVEGVEKPFVNKGFITVPDKPGLGVTLNEEVMKQASDAVYDVLRAGSGMERRPFERSALEPDESPHYGCLT